VSRTPAVIIASLRPGDAANSFAFLVSPPSIKDDNNLALVAIGGMIDPWIDKARRPLHFGMLIEDRMPLAIISDFVPDNDHPNGILPLLPN
jgi:hypothetical protein